MTNDVVDETDSEDTIVAIEAGWLGLRVSANDDNEMDYVFARQRRHAEGQPTVLVEMADDGTIRVHIRGAIPGQIFVTEIKAAEATGG